MPLQDLPGGAELAVLEEEPRGDEDLRGQEPAPREGLHGLSARRLATSFGADPPPKGGRGATPEVPRRCCRLQGQQRRLLRPAARSGVQLHGQLRCGGGGAHGRVVQRELGALRGGGRTGRNHLGDEPRRGHGPQHPGDGHGARLGAPAQGHVAQRDLKRNKITIISSSSSSSSSSRSMSIISIISLISIISNMIN